jgi:hypothetical protein
MRIVFSGAAFEVQHDEVLQVVVLRRSPARLTLPDVGPAFVGVHPVLARLAHGDTAILVDMRAAPLRNEEAYEQAMGEAIEQAVAGFRRKAILVRTAVGALQVSRTTRHVWDDDTARPEVFRDESEAMHYLHS